MKKLQVLLLALAGTFVFGAANTAPVSAESLKIKPLIITENVETENKKGFVDISNPTASPVIVQIEVQAFRQVNDQGELEFYADPLVSAGITPDLSEFELGPREELRLYYGVDNQKLPKKQVFAAILARTVGSKAGQTSIANSARVGTLLILQNGGQELRNGSFVAANISPFQFGDGISGSVTYKNTGTGQAATGFFPQFSASAYPGGPSKTFTGGLLFPGIRRETAFDIPGSYIGIYQLEVKADSNKATQLMLVVTGYWRWLLPLMLMIAGGMIFGAIRSRSSRRNRAKKLHGSKL